MGEKLDMPGKNPIETGGSGKKHEAAQGKPLKEKRPPKKIEKAKQPSGPEITPGQGKQLRTIEQAQKAKAEELETLASIKADKETAWLARGQQGLPQSRVAREVFEELSVAPKNLLQNREYLINQGKKLRAALKEDVPREHQAEARALIGTIWERLTKLEGVDLGDVSIRRSQNPEIQNKVQFLENARQQLMGEESGMVAPAGPVGPDSWIDRDANGNPLLVPQDRPGHNLAALRQVLAEARSIGSSANPGEYERLYQRLKDLPHETGHQVEEQDIRPYSERMIHIGYSLFGDRFRPTAELIKEIERDPIKRDEEFYKRLKPLLEKPDQEAHRVMGLYEEADLNSFLHAVGEIRDLNGERIGDELRSRYEVRVDAIKNLHDVDYWARHGSGDIKSYAGTVAHIQNYHAKEAMSDPFVETMRNCYEKALLFIRASHNGYIPPNLVTPDPLRGGRTFWDELALRFFREKVGTGQVFDVVRDEVTGIPQRDERGNAYLLRDNPTTLQEIGRQDLRILATQQIAKGLLVLDERTLEIIGMSKVPGFDHKDFGIKEPGFSSKAYGQLARWFNPIAEWMGKYKMGTTLHLPFFQTLVEGRPRVLRWSSNQWRRAMEAVMDGRLEAVFPKAKRFIDMMEEFSFSGRWGPMSKWGTRDATIGWSDRDKERLGGSMRMVFAGEWADKKIKDVFKQAHPGQSESWYEQEWEKVKVHKEWKTRIDNLTNAKRAWLWVQTTARHPTIVAGYLKERVVVNGQPEMRPIRDSIIKDIFAQAGLDIELEEYYKISNRTPRDQDRELLLQIAQLEGDVDAVQQRAMNTRQGRPRDIEEGDFDIIADPERRHRAQGYWWQVQRRVLGEWSADDWYNHLGVPGTYLAGQTDDVLFGNYMDINGILREVAGRPGLAPLLNEQLVDRGITMQHVSTEDVQWRFLDVDTLGPPHWNRRAGDLSMRIEATQKEIEFLDMLVANPDRKKLAAKLNEVFMAEKNHDPDQAHKFMYIFALATGEIYRQAHWGKIPILGKIGSRIIPSSIAQKYFETPNAAAWSANNEREFVDQFSDGRTLPLKEFYGGKHWGRYNAQELAKELGATRATQILEMIIIGSSLAAVATALFAATKSFEEETKG